MAWRPARYLIKGELDNTTPGKVTGYMSFAGLSKRVRFDLAGDFHRDIRGCIIRFKGDGKRDDLNAKTYMKGFALTQIGKVGDITAGNPPQDYVDYPYIEWYGDDNGRICMESPNDFEIIGTPKTESEPMPRQQQVENMVGFLRGCFSGRT
jgi:hypothetical protein